MTYNRFIQGLKAADVDVDRRMLAELAVNDPAAFTALVKGAKGALPPDVHAPAAESGRAASSRARQGPQGLGRGPLSRRGGPRASARVRPPGRGGRRAPRGRAR